jgi:cation diffusion facilitator family transporter
MTVGLGLVLLVVAAGIGWDAVRRLFHPEALLVPGVIALVVAAASVLAKEALYWYTLAVARRIRSNLLRANAWHHRSDAASSVVVIVGVGGTMAGLPYLDAIAAIGVAFMVAKIGWDLGWHSLRELVDTALDAETVEAIRKEIAEVDGVHSVHQLRTRRMGPDALVDVHVLVEPRLSVSEGHHISESVRFRLVRRFDEVQDVLVHIDPEDDENATPSINLAPRRAILAALSPHWVAALPPAVTPQRIELHYLDGRVYVELYLPLAVLGHGEGDTMRAALTASAEAHPDVAEVTTYFA